MPQWRKTVNIKDLIGEDADRATVRKTAKAMHERLAVALKEEIESGDDLTIDLIVDDFLAIAEDESADADDFNIVLDELYDWADGNRVWLGL